MDDVRFSIERNHELLYENFHFQVSRESWWRFLSDRNRYHWNDLRDPFLAFALLRDYFEWLAAPSAKAVQTVIVEVLDDDLSLPPAAPSKTLSPG
jgi:hypothetical protein